MTEELEQSEEFASDEINLDLNEQEQGETTWTKIPNHLLNGIYTNFPPLTKTEIRILLFLCRHILGYHHDKRAMSLSWIAEKLEMDRSRVSKAIQKLTKFDFIEKTSDSKKINCYKIANFRTKINTKNSG